MPLMNTNETIPFAVHPHGDARRQVELAYDRWFAKTDDAGAAAILTQCELQLHLQVAGGAIPSQPGALSVKQVAAELGVSRETVYKLCSENALRHTRVGRRITITRQQLDDYQNRPRFRHLAA